MADQLNGPQQTNQSQQSTPQPTPQPMSSQPGQPRPQSPQQPSGYGKRPMWQWVVLYVLVAIVLYGLIWYFFFRGDGQTTY